MRNFVSPHVHIKSLDSASTPKKFAERELELGTGYIVTTDHGTLEATRAIYDLCAPGGKYHGKLKPILGLEGYFRDDSDSHFLSRGIERKPDPDGTLTFRDRYKYAHITLHTVDEPAYYALVKKLSDADLRAEQHGNERKPLFDWTALEELGQHNITATSGCLIGMVGRHLIANNDATAAKHFYERLRSTFRPGNFYVEIFPHVTDRKFESAILIVLEDGTSVSYKSTRKFKTASLSDGGEIYGAELAAAFKEDPVAARAAHKSILDVMENRKWSGTQHLGLVSVELKEGLVYNECKPWCNHSDYQLEVNRFLASMAKKYGDPLLISDDSHFATPDEKVLQDVRLGGWRFAQSHHRMSSEEAWAYFDSKLDVSRAQFDGWVENGYAWASRFDSFKFSARQTLPTTFYPQDTMRHLFTLIQKHRRMNWDNPAMVARLKSEIALLHRSGVDLLPYFFVDEEVCDLYLRKGQLTGPGRGSAAGLLVTYLLGITHVNPLDKSEGGYNLSQDRFLTADRVASGKMPDIDQDLPHRDLLVDKNDPTKGWLRERFGENVAQMSVDIALKLKNAIKDVHRVKDKHVSSEINEICASLPDQPQGIDSKDFVFGYEVDGTYTEGLIETNKTLQDYAAKFPEHWAVVQGLLGLPRQKGRHPCGFLIANQPVDSFIPLTTVGGVRVTAFTASSVEAAGGLKMDFLTVNSIRDVGNAVRLIQERYDPAIVPVVDDVKYVKTLDGSEIPTVRAIPYKGGYVDVWKLPEELSVSTDICKGKVETVFQLDGGAARAGLRSFGLKPDGTPPLKSIEDLSAFTALDRPGPLDAFVEGPNGERHNMLVEYANRARGEAGVGRVPILDEMLPETHGVIVYQEQLQHIFRVVGGTTGIQANDFRQRIGKKKLVEVRKKDKPLFYAGAVPKLGQEATDVLWGMMETFGQYGFNKSHSVCYMHTAYACAFLKHYYPLEWWTSVLSNADRNDVDEKFWKYVGPIVLPPEVKKSGANFVIEGDKIRAPLWMVHGIGEKAHALLEELRPYTDIKGLLTKINEWRIAHGHPVTKKDKKGNEVQTIKKAHNPLDNSILRNLIVCGVFDSLFPEVDESGLPVVVQDRLSMFDKAGREVVGKTFKVAAVNFNLASPIARFQYIKSVMPAHSEDLAVLLAPVLDKKLVRKGDSMVYCPEDSPDAYTVVDGGQLEWLQNLPIAPKTDLAVATFAYVVSQRLFKYQNGTKQACEFVLDIGGHRQAVVKWPSKKTGLPPLFREKLTGAIVAATFTRSSSSDGFFFEAIDVIAPPLNQKEESSDA